MGIKVLSKRMKSFWVLGKGMERKRIRTGVVEGKGGGEGLGEADEKKR